MPTTRNGEPAASSFHLFRGMRSMCGDWQRFSHFDPLETTVLSAPHLCLTCRRRLKHVAGPVVWEKP